MRLLVSGEGPTDMGTIRPGPTGAQYIPGPMALIVDKLLYEKLGYSQLEAKDADPDALGFINEKQLATIGKQLKFLPGNKRLKGHIYYVKNAFMLGQKALQDQQEFNRPVLAVLFRDADGTNSAPNNDWEEKFKSMKTGFEVAEFKAGVPMIPKPKSEAWLLCALKNQPYQDCAALEDLSGNDVSPNSLKMKLAAIFDGHELSAAEQADLVSDGRVNPGEIDMPSFKAFREELDRAYIEASMMVRSI